MVNLKVESVYVWHDMPVCVYVWLKIILSTMGEFYQQCWHVGRETEQNSLACCATHVG